MLWTLSTIYREEKFEQERDLEEAILQIAPTLFGDSRIYLDAKRKIGGRGHIRNIPDGYLLDLTSTREPKLYVVENELAAHEPLRHIAVQILEFSLSFESSPDLVKDIVKDALKTCPDAMQNCSDYATKHGFENVDYLLERMIFGINRFNALVIIDELDDELEKVLISRFKFPVEILTLERFLGPSGERVFKFNPFLADVTTTGSVPATTDSVLSTIDPSEIDTIVVPAHDEGFNDTFLGENRWHHIRMHSSMILRIKNVAVYRVAPESAITHIAPVASIEQWQDTPKYVLNFSEPARPIGPIRLLPNGKVTAPRGPRYTSKARLEQAKTLDDAF
jgi:hypothetical protein